MALGRLLSSLLVGQRVLRSPVHAKALSGVLRQHLVTCCKANAKQYTFAKEPPDFASPQSWYEYYNQDAPKPASDLATGVDPYHPSLDHPDHLADEHLGKPLEPIKTSAKAINRVLVEGELEEVEKALVEAKHKLMMVRLVWLEQEGGK